MTAATNVVAYQPPHAAPQSHGPLLPNTIGEAMQLARLMSEARMVPKHLQGSPADCYLIVNQARLWRMDPFAVAQGTSFIHGKMMYEGKLIAGVVHNLGNLKGRLSYGYDGAGDNRTVTVSGTLVGEDAPRTVAVKLKDARTDNRMWTSQPDQQLAYHAVRVWARRHTPEVIYGVYAPEEWPMVAAEEARDITPPRAVEAAPPPPPKPPRPPIEIALPNGWEPAKFDRTKKGLKEALEFLTAAVLDGAPIVVSLNNSLLDQIAETMPALAGEVSELRAAAAEALAPAGDADAGPFDPDERDAFGLPPEREEVLPTDPP